MRCAGHHGPYALKVPKSPEAEDDAELEANQSEQELGILAVTALLLLQFLLLLMSSITIVSVRNYSRFLLLQKMTPSELFLSPAFGVMRSFYLFLCIRSPSLGEQ